VAECESGVQQYNSDGTILKDNVYGTHYGLFQISKGWIPTAKAHGWDIFTPEGNVAMALYLYKQHGLRDWKASQECWGKYDT